MAITGRPNLFRLAQQFQACFNYMRHACDQYKAHDRANSRTIIRLLEESEHKARVITNQLSAAPTDEIGRVLNLMTGGDWEAERASYIAARQHIEDISNALKPHHETLTALAAKVDGQRNLPSEGGSPVPSEIADIIEPLVDALLVDLS